MLIFSIIWNAICIAFMVYLAITMDTPVANRVAVGVLCSAVSWGIINVLLAIFVRKKDAFARKCKNWRTFYGFIASIVIASFDIAYIPEEGVYPIWKLVVVVSVVFAIRGLFAYLYSNKRITRLLEKSIVIDNSEKDIATVTYKRASLLLPKVVDIVVPHNECGGFYKKDQTIAFLSVADSIVPISAPADCVCAWLAFELDEVMVTYKVIHGFNICALAFAGERVCGADETVKGE